MSAIYLHEHDLRMGKQPLDRWTVRSTFRVQLFDLLLSPKLSV
ncbi:MAG: hypothetical protein BSOLF_0160 [Candidatus Carbobacillus altaicus]|uniref:Uncharacterized protein n=1 Tax=Candidatus Carbonibacillus altaicus TaxID=2163959 RepID=A0A2R6XXH0_9BACL|nr:MAG: hypothetical protein BSOLF_0160 [Candidatus Carbobacillus altaicus]